MSLGRRSTARGDDAGLGEWLRFRWARRFASLPLLFAALVVGCDVSEDAVGPSVDDDPSPIVDDVDFETPDWTTATHSNDAEPNFGEVFADNTVKRVDIVISEDRWAAMLDDMTALYGAFGSGGRAGLASSDIDPAFVPAELYYDGTQWYRVGVRFKGNSSLQTAWRNGILKLSFKLDFDEYEDDYPQIDNQRFYGFKKLSLKNNYDDRSMLREKVAGDVFRNVGLASPHTAFYSVYVDFGEGPVYFGVYTMVEEVDDTVLDTQFLDDDGNLYKPDGNGASFASGTFTEDVFVKKTNEDVLDWSDISSLFAALHDGTRATDPQTWRTNLEAVFDTDVFLKYLAANTVVQNWDTYGRMTHNYYLYNDPDTGRLTWIPWDNNEALQEGKMGGALNLDFSDLTPGAWPLIEYLYGDPQYRAQNDALVDEVVTGAFAPSEIQAKYSTYASLLEPYATAETPGYSFLNNSGDFQIAIAQLQAHVTARTSAASQYLGGT